MQSTNEGILRLADGRRLGYAEWGPPDAPPIIYCHGSPGNRLELEIARPVVERSSIRARVIAFDRPGFGLSSWRGGHRYLDWPEDVAQAADLLGLDRFGVLGASGGAPFALACGLRLGDRVTRIGLVVGSGPVEATGMENSAAMTLPSSNAFVRRAQYEMIAYAFKRGWEARVVERSVASMGETDRRAMERPEIRNWFIALFREAVRQGGRASAYEAGLALKPWEFDVSHITVPTDLWYGGKDRHVPASVGQWFADRIPNARYVVWPHHGHFTWAAADEVSEVVATLAASEEADHEGNHVRPVRTARGVDADRGSGAEPGSG